MLVKFASRVGAISGRCIKRAVRLSSVSPNTQVVFEQNPNRSFSALSVNKLQKQLSPIISRPILLEASSICVSGTRTLQTKGDQDLVDFLEKEISSEKKSRKKLPDLSPFEASFDDAEVTLTRKSNKEVITIKFNINNSLDEEDEADDTAANEVEQPEMTSKPNFTVEIEKSGMILSLDCSFTKDYDQQQEREPDSITDVFIINEMSVYKGDFSETTYSTSGDILDGSLYDLLLIMLEDRGINNEFVEKICEFSTAYEHERYVNLLENLKKFFN